MLRDQYSGALSINSPLFEIKAQQMMAPSLPHSIMNNHIKAKHKGSKTKTWYLPNAACIHVSQNGILLRTSLNLIPTLFNCVPAAKYLDVNIQQTNPSQTDGRILTFLSFSLNLTSFTFVFICTSFFFKRWNIWMRDPSIPTGGQLHTMQNHFQLVKQSRF